MEATRERSAIGEPREGYPEFGKVNCFGPDNGGVCRPIGRDCIGEMSRVLDPFRWAKVFVIFSMGLGSIQIHDEYSVLRTP